LGCHESINIRNIDDSLKCIKSISYEKCNRYDNLTLLTDSRMAFTAYNSAQSNPIIILDIKVDYNIIKIVQANEDYISCLVKQSNIIATSSPINVAIKIWDINENSDIKLITQITGHTSMIMALLFTKGKYLLSGSCDETIRVWNLEDYLCVKIIDDNCATSMLLLPNGYFAVSSGKIYDMNDFNCVNTLVFNEYYISCMLFIKGNIIVTGSRDNTIILWSY
jgi:WD40 repeat protein